MLDRLWYRGTPETEQGEEEKDRGKHLTNTVNKKQWEIWALALLTGSHFIATLKYEKMPLHPTYTFTLHISTHKALVYDCRSYKEE